MLLLWMLKLFRSILGFIFYYFNDLEINRKVTGVNAAKKFILGNRTLLVQWLQL